jgi:hypothetical protein
MPKSYHAGFDGYLSTYEVAERKHCGQHTVNTACNQGELNWKSDNVKKWVKDDAKLMLWIPRRNKKLRGERCEAYRSTRKRVRG